VEGAQGADSPGCAPDTFLPPGASARFCLDGGVNTPRPLTPGDRVTPCSCRLTLRCGPTAAGVSRRRR
jgi:hypothetical protein